MLCTDICGYSPVVTGAAFLAASEVLWGATGRQFGNCPVTVRPCRAECASYDDRALDNGWPHPGLYNGVWLNVACGVCGANACSCTNTSEVLLPEFARIVYVTVDGVVLNEDAWVLYDGVRLVRIGAEWPICQSWAVTGGVGAWSITASFGPELTDLGKLAVGILGVEIMKQMCGEDCALPFKTVSVTRRGVTMTRDTEGLTGLTIPDLFIRTYNPGKIQDRARIYSPDVTLPRLQS
jgi:hypothetical protein